MLFSSSFSKSCAFIHSPFQKVSKYSKSRGGPTVVIRLVSSLVLPPPPSPVLYSLARTCIPSILLASARTLMPAWCGRHGRIHDPGVSRFRVFGSFRLHPFFDPQGCVTPAGPDAGQRARRGRGCLMSLVGTLPWTWDGTYMYNV